jgi:hypothetical protein
MLQLILLLLVVVVVVVVVVASAAAVSAGYNEALSNPDYMASSSGMIMNRTLTKCGTKTE